VVDNCVRYVDPLFVILECSLVCSLYDIYMLMAFIFHDVASIHTLCLRPNPKNI
jgi:hypothetical protein